jgi:arylformamidase
VRQPLNYAYGPHERNQIDVFVAPNARPGGPTLVAIHGGLWFLFDKWMMHFLVLAFADAGVHVVCPNYRLAPGATLGDIVNDCRRAISFVIRMKLGLATARSMYSDIRRPGS